MRVDLNSLPTCMVDRAVWARCYAAKNPELVLQDDQLLPWVYNENDNLWYSFDGNYSQFSPEEKIQKKKLNNEKLKTASIESEIRWIEKLEEIKYWSSIRNNILERDNYMCQLCNKKADSKLHIHHILKRKEGGTDHFDNLITICPGCHKKADTTLYNPNWNE